MPVTDNGVADDTFNSIGTNDKVGLVSSVICKKYNFDDQMKHVPLIGNAYWILWLQSPREAPVRQETLAYIYGSNISTKILRDVITDRLQSPSFLGYAQHTVEYWAYFASNISETHIVQKSIVCPWYEA